jgi:putative peptidoglycan lipid II flippase
MLLRQPIVSLLYQRGQFDAAMTELVAWALLWFAAGLIGHSILEVLTRAFYAQHDTRTPVIVGASAMALNIALSLALAAGFTRIGWMPHGGLALANSLATALEAAGLFILLRRRIGLAEDRTISQAMLQALAGTAALCLVVWPLSRLAFPVWIITIGGITMGAAAYFLVLKQLGVQELSALLDWVDRRLTRR